VPPIIFLSSPYFSLLKLRSTLPGDLTILGMGGLVLIFSWLPSCVCFDGDCSILVLLFHPGFLLISLYLLVSRLSLKWLLAETKASSDVYLSIFGSSFQVRPQTRGSGPDG